MYMIGFRRPSSLLPHRHVCNPFHLHTSPLTLLNYIFYFFLGLVDPYSTGFG